MQNYRSSLYPSRLGPLRRRWTPLVPGLQYRQPGPGPGLLSGRRLLGVDVLLVLLGCCLLHCEQRRARLAGRRAAQHPCSRGQGGMTLRRQAACTRSRRPAAPSSAPVVAARRSPGQPARPPSRQGSLRTGEAAKGAGTAGRRARSPRDSASSPPEPRLFLQFKYPATIEIDQ